MKLEELKKQLPAWKESNAEFYNNYVHAIRGGKATLSAYMHIYDYAMGLISDLPQTVKFGSYGTIFKNYHYKLGFNGLLGMLLQVFENDKMLYFQAQLNREKLKMAILYWFLFDDYHYNLMLAIKKYPSQELKMQLEELEEQLIENALVLGIKDREYWEEQLAKGELIITGNKLRKCFFAESEENFNVEEFEGIDELQENVTSNDFEDDEEAKDDTEVSDSELLKEKVITCNDKPQCGRKPAFFGIDSLQKLFALKMNQEKASRIVTMMENEASSKQCNGIKIVSMVVALEESDYIDYLLNGKASGFYDLLPEKCRQVLAKDTFLRHYRNMHRHHFEKICFGKKIKEETKENREKEIKRYILMFQGIK